GGLGLVVGPLGLLGLGERPDDEDLVPVIGDLGWSREPVVRKPSHEPAQGGARYLFHDYKITPVGTGCQPPPPPSGPRSRTWSGARRGPAARPCASGAPRGRGGGGRSGSRRCSRPRTSPAPPSPP